MCCRLPTGTAPPMGMASGSMAPPTPVYHPPPQEAIAVPLSESDVPIRAGQVGWIPTSHIQP